MEDLVLPLSRGAARLERGIPARYYLPTIQSKKKERKIEVLELALHRFLSYLLRLKVFVETGQDLVIKFKDLKTSLSYIYIYIDDDFFFFFLKHSGFFDETIEKKVARREGHQVFKAREIILCNFHFDFLFHSHHHSLSLTNDITTYHNCPSNKLSLFIIINITRSHNLRF
jgi:hypothetical protein